MNKEELQKIASTMTEEEFKQKYFKEDINKDIVLVVNKGFYVCPRRVELANTMDENNDFCCKNCEKCWNNAIKELKFKGENEMNKEKLQEIASVMTEEEFKSKYIVINYGGEEILNIDGEEFVCPNRIGLKNTLLNFHKCCSDCKECWENAIKELNFKEDNMKELNIIEASKMPNTEFEVVYPNGNKRSRKLKTDSNGNLYNYDNEPFENAYFHDIIQAKFIPLPKEIEVDFMEAIKAFKEGKRIKSVWGKDEFIYEGELTDSEDKAIQADEILKAKWYIIND